MGMYMPFRPPLLVGRQDIPPSLLCVHVRLDIPSLLCVHVHAHGALDTKRVLLRRAGTLCASMPLRAVQSRCVLARWDAEAELPQLVAEIARLLRPRGGRAVLLMKGCRRLERLLGAGGEEEAAAAAAGRPRLVLVGKRRVAVGGFSCYALTLEPQPLL